jgi:tetratricopeptide (TPR) repeat protein
LAFACLLCLGAGVACGSGDASLDAYRAHVEEARRLLREASPLEVLAAAEAASKIRPDLPGALVVAGSALVKAGRLREAEAFFIAAAKRTPPERREPLQSIIRDLGRERVRLEVVRRAVSQERDGRLEAAAETYERAWRMSEEDAASGIRSAAIWHSLGNRNRHDRILGEIGRSGDPEAAAIARRLLVVHAGREPVGFDRLE